MFHLSLKSKNHKTGPIPVSTSGNETCPDSCPLKSNGCYADRQPMWFHWNKVSKGLRGVDWGGFLALIKALPTGQLWRHNQAGDLPGENEQLNVKMLNELVLANAEKRGFTFTHKPLTSIAVVAIRKANENGLTINISADNEVEADHAKGLGLPVALVVDAHAENFTTKAGNRVVICPAQRSKAVTCATCGICAISSRKSIIGFRRR